MKWQMAGWLSAGHERGLRFLGVEAIDAFVSAAGKGERLWRYLTISGAGSTGQPSAACSKTAAPSMTGQRRSTPAQPISAIRTPSSSSARARRCADQDFPGSPRGRHREAHQGRRRWGAPQAAKLAALMNMPSQRVSPSGAFRASGLELAIARSVFGYPRSTIPAQRRGRRYALCRGQRSSAYRRSGDT